MRTVVKIEVPTELLPLFRYAQLLESLDGSRTRPDADQYRLLVNRLSAELREHQAHESLGSLLDHFPIAAEAYENQQYAHAGLCRAPQNAAFRSELAAREVLERIGRRA